MVPVYKTLVIREKNLANQCSEENLLPGESTGVLRQAALFFFAGYPCICVLRPKLGQRIFCAAQFLSAINKESKIYI